MRLIDISQPLSTTVGVFPGDTPFSIHKVMKMADGASCDTSTITSSLHAGTHSDAPNHFRRGALGIDRVPLEKYFGPAKVVQRIGNGPVTPEDVLSWNPMRGMRYLLRSRENVDPADFPAAFAHLTPAAALVLAEAEVALFGIDTPSVDHQDSKTLDAHKGLVGGGVAILENLDLSAVRPGNYELIAFPIRIAGADAAPVRAVLRSLM